MSGKLTVGRCVLHKALNEFQWTALQEKWSKIRHFTGISALGLLLQQLADSAGRPVRRIVGFGKMRKFGLDATDIRILTAVQQHGQLSKTRLAEIANISPTPCWARLDRLKAAGFIRSYHAEIALERICDFAQVVVTVSLTHHRKADFDRFEAFVMTHDEFTECIATGGGMDYVLKAVCPNLTAFQSLMQAMLDAELGVDRYMTYIVTRSVKTSRPNLARLAAATPR